MTRFRARAATGMLLFNVVGDGGCVGMETCTKNNVVGDGGQTKCGFKVRGALILGEVRNNDQA